MPRSLKVDGVPKLPELGAEVVVREGVTEVEEEEAGVEGVDEEEDSDLKTKLERLAIGCVQKPNRQTLRRLPYDDAIFLCIW